MTPDKFKTLIMSFTDDVVFSYRGKTACINPWNDKKYELGFGDVGKTYASIDELMSDPVFDGKSLNQIVGAIEII